MKRRRNSTDTISLFSFQDIMASVIGMLFFVVILLSLSIVSEAVSAADSSLQSCELPNLRQRLAELRDELALLELRAAQAARRSVQASAIEPGPALAELMGMQQNLRNLYQTLNQEQVLLAELLARREARGAEARAVRGRLEDIQEELARTRKRLEGLQSAPRLAFIIDDHPSRLEPWLLEVSGSAIRVGSRDGGSAVLEFHGQDHRQRVALLLEWARTQNTRTHYFVILLKPSAATDSDDLRQGLRDIGFEFGLDLLPEDWRPF